MKSVFAANLYTNSAVSADCYMPLISGGFALTIPTTEANAQSKAPADGTLRNLGIYIHANTRSSTTTLYVRKNGSNTAVAVPIGAGVTGWLTDLVNSVTFLEDDLLGLFFDFTTGSGSIEFRSFSVEAEWDAGNHSILQAGDNRSGAVTGLESTGNATTGYVYPFGSTSALIINSLTESSVQQEIPLAATISNMRVLVTTNARSTDTVFTFRKNGADGAQTITVPAGATGWFEDTSNTDTVAAGDLLAYEVANGSGSGTLRFNAIQAQVHADNDECFLAATATPGTFGNNSTNGDSYYSPAGVYRWGLTEAELQLRIPFDCTLTRISIDSEGSKRFVTRINGADGSLSVTVGGSAGLVINTGSDPVVAGDFLSIQRESANTTTTILRALTLVMAGPAPEDSNSNSDDPAPSGARRGIIVVT